MRRCRYFFMEFLKSVRNGRFPFCVVCFALLCLAFGAGDIGDLIMHQLPCDVIYLYCVTFMTDGWFLCILYALASYAAVASVCHEWRENFWKPVLFRCGKSKFLFGSSSFGFLSGFMTALLGQILFCTVLFVLCLLSGTGFYNVLTSYGWCSIPEHPGLFLLLRILMFAFSVGFWTMVSVLTALLTLDLFLSLAVPMVFNITVNLMIKSFSPGGLDLNGIVTGGWMGSSTEFIRSAGFVFCFFGFLSLIVFFLIYVTARKRVENELRT